MVFCYKVRSFFVTHKKMGELFCFVPQNDRDGRRFWNSTPTVHPWRYSSTNVEVLEYPRVRTAVLTCKDWPRSRENRPKACKAKDSTGGGVPPRYKGPHTTKPRRGDRIKGRSVVLTALYNYYSSFTGAYTPACVLSPLWGYLQTRHS